MKHYRYIDLVMAAFITVLLTSNVASSAKIVDWGISILGLRLSFDAGTILFPLSYIFGDVLTEVYGFNRARRTIWMGFFGLMLMSVCLGIVERMPGEAQWQEYAGDASYSAILGGLSSGGIVIASLCAYVMGEFSNSFTLARLKIMSEGRHLWMRTIGSTLIGQGIDTSVFILLACSFGVFPWSIASSLIVSNYIFKVLIEVLCTPITYWFIGLLKKIEKEDYFDRDTNFNPFAAS